ncbi:SurA N-terminal domain-containing protein [Atopomonas sediminilitoris]|uniref:SurA N-terminal domain-containing protein n=1 Tax=Atopomonas sediminilitoris TaxID=2919919 RepID=UPI001F4EAE38|nr:SurA N-terminal domain-containing protein [Atopomonas sediminilitoris]MCJ8168027.1 SurA N-terminal domain-containing protein [Atopomonas sediminilitoris]
MLQNIRDNSQSMISKVVIGAVVLVMALFGFDGIVSLASNSQDAASVNGQVIAKTELEQAVERQRRSLAQQLGNQFDESLIDDKLLRESALKGLVERSLLIQAAQDGKMDLAPQALDQLILQEKAFQLDGKFNAQRFDQLISQSGLTRQGFRDSMTQDVLLNQLRLGVGASDFATAEEVAALAALEQQKRDFALHTIKADSSAINPSDDEVADYFENHQVEFMSPEQVIVEYITLNKAHYFDQVELSEEALEALYREQIANLGEQRRAAHILIETSDAVSDEQAQAKLAEIKARLAKGEAFADLAKELSDDKGSAADGGDLGFAGPGVYDPEFEKALFALKPEAVSDAVKTEFGWHLITLLGVQAADVPTMDSMRAQLEQELKNSEVEKLFVEGSRELESLAFEASDLQQPAEELGLKVQTSAAFGRNGGEGVLANPQVARAAFSEEVLQDAANSSLLELDADTVLVLRAKEHLKPKQQALADVSAAIADLLKQQQAADKAKAQADTLLAALKAGSAAELQWQVTKDGTRMQEGVNPQVLQAVFRQPKPTADQPVYAQLAMGNGDVVVVRVDAVTTPKAELNKEEQAMFQRYLASRNGQQAFEAYRVALKESADIEEY